jgi:translation initiation factor IF-1
MPETKSVELEGTVTQTFANTRFRVQLDTGTEVLAHVAGRMPGLSGLYPVIRFVLNYRHMT